MKKKVSASEKISISLLECSGSKLPAREVSWNSSLCVARCRKAKEQLDGRKEEMLEPRSLLSY